MIKIIRSLFAWLSGVELGVCKHCGARVHFDESECDQCYLGRQY